MGLNKAVVPELVLAGLFGLGISNSVSADTVPFTAFNYNNSTPSASTGSGTTSAVGGTSVSYASGSPEDTASPNEAFAVSGFPAQGVGSGTAGAQFNVSTLGEPSTGNALQISFDFRQSGTSSEYYQLQLSSDGTTFSNASGGFGSVAGPVNPSASAAQNSNTSFSSSGLYLNNTGSGSQQFVEGLTYTLAPGSMYQNDANFAFRFVSVFAPGTSTYVAASAASTYGTAGTARFDEVTVSSVPLPTAGTMAFALMGGIGIVGAIRRSSFRHAQPIA